MSVLPHKKVLGQSCEKLLAAWAVMRWASEMLAEEMQDCERDSFVTCYSCLRT